MRVSQWLPHRLVLHVFLLQFGKQHFFPSSVLQQRFRHKRRGGFFGVVLGIKRHQKVVVLIGGTGGTALLLARSFELGRGRGDKFLFLLLLGTVGQYTFGETS